MFGDYSKTNRNTKLGQKLSGAFDSIVQSILREYFTWFVHREWLCKKKTVFAQKFESEVKLLRFCIPICSVIGIQYLRNVSVSDASQVYILWDKY